MLKGFEISSVFVAVIIQSAATNSVVPLAHESNNVSLIFHYYKSVKDKKEM